MKKTLARAPLVHTLIHLKFSQVPNLKSIEPELINALHIKMMNEGFPEKIESQADILEWNFDAVSQQVRQKKLSTTRLLFRAAGEREIFEISDSYIIIKSTCYSTFREFYDKFHRLLKVCLETIPTLDKILLKSVGLRYVDVIVPTNGSTLSDFVQGGIQPLSIGELGEHLHGQALKTVKVADNQILVINFEELPTSYNRVIKVLPDNLMEPDEKCGLIIDGQKDWMNIESTTYGILDIDHTYQFTHSPVFNLSRIEEATNSLYQKASDLFWSVITEQAKNAWGYKETE